MTMEHINHFADEELITLNVFESEFKYKQLVVEDEMKMDFSYCKVDGEFIHKRYLLLRLAHNIKEVPYSEEDIFKIIGVKISWSDLKIKERIGLFLKLRSIILSKLLDEADKVDMFDNEVKKNLETKSSTELDNTQKK